MPGTPPLVTFDNPDIDLELAGGKGSNLARLTRAGLPVPPGFIVPTPIYRQFVEQNRLGQVIAAALEGLRGEDMEGLEQASATIRAAFMAGKMDESFASALHQACINLSEDASETKASAKPGELIPVAVRSSATAEDLPDLSFAGQQDTYLNVRGADALQQAVVRCWASLWTGRAIGYRLRNGIDQSQVSLAVVVQAMVESDVSGVMFTANPLTGLLNETVIDATFGLGEALVSGQVEPDHYVVDVLSGKLIQVHLGAKQVATRSKSEGGVETLDQESAGKRSLTAGKRALTDEQIFFLVEAGLRIYREYGTPQDIEWAFSNSRLYILQARAITSLFPVPKVSFDPLITWISFGAVQGLVGPMTPLGIDVIRYILLGAGSLFGAHLRYDQQDILVAAGERIWIKFTDLLRHPIGSQVIPVLRAIGEPSVGKILQTLSRDPRLGYKKGRLKPRTMFRLARFFVPVILHAVHTLFRPAAARQKFDRYVDERLARLRIAPASDRYQRLAQLLKNFELGGGLSNALADMFPPFFALFAPAMLSLKLLNDISEDKTLVLEATRSLPHNVTTEMDLAMWQTAVIIRQDSAANQAFSQQDANQLAQAFLENRLPPPAQTAVADFLNRYGMRGVGEIDFGQPRWREQPEPVMHTLKSYIQIDRSMAPDIVFQRGEQAAFEATEKLVDQARHQKGGWIKARIVRFAARRIRLLMGARESPKFYIIRCMGILRQELLVVGKEFAASQEIERPDDMAFLTLTDLSALSQGEKRDWKGIIATRRASYDRELRRRQAPRVLLSDGRAFYEGVGAETDTGDIITGSPVSPGIAEGRVHVVLDPRQAHLAPGEILVCPGTDPAWTPLFMAAGGLVMEVGGMMTHGSVVAREYGIPAVVGVHQATQRLKDGQRIRLDGSAGKIILLGD